MVMVCMGRGGESRTAAVLLSLLNHPLVQTCTTTPLVPPPVRVKKGSSGTAAMVRQLSSSSTCAQGQAPDLGVGEGSFAGVRHEAGPDRHGQDIHASGDYVQSVSNLGGPTPAQHRRTARPCGACRKHPRSSSHVHVACPHVPSLAVCALHRRSVQPCVSQEAARKTMRGGRHRVHALTLPHTLWAVPHSVCAAVAMKNSAKGTPVEGY